MAFETAPPTSWTTRLRWAVGGLLAVWVLLSLAVPRWVKHEIEREGAAALGRTVSVGQVGFAPWSLRLTVNDLKIGAAQGRGWQFTLARLEANLELESLLRMAPVLDSLVLDIPHLNLARTGDGHYDIDDVLQRLNQPSATPDAKPLQFALYNVQVHNGSADFADTLPSGVRQHALRKLEISVPFLSNLDYRRKAKVQPHLAFELNGSQVDTALQGAPFDTTPTMEAHVKVPRLDIAPWLPYLPAGLAVRPVAGLLDMDVRVAFADGPRTSVKVSGHLGASGLVLKEAAHADASANVIADSNTDLLRAASVQMELEDVRPLERVATLASLTLEAPVVRWVHRRTGRLKVDLMDATAPLDATETIAAHAQPERAAGRNGIKTAAEPQGWTVALHALRIARGQAVWRDENTRPAASVAMADVDLQASDLRWPQTDQPLVVQASANFPDTNSNSNSNSSIKAKPSRLVLQGNATAAGGSLRLQLSDGALALAEPWVREYLVPPLRGTVDAKLDVRWQGDSVHITIPQLTATGLALAGAAAPAGAAQRSGPSSADMPRVQLLELRDGSVDLAARSAVLGKLTLRAPSTGVRRGEDGRWMVQSWIKPRKAAEDNAPSAPWRVRLDALTVSAGTVAFSDRSKTKPVRMELTELALQTGPFDISGTTPASVTLAARLRSGQTEPGSLKFKGTAAWAPVRLDGDVDAIDVPAHALVPYFADRLNMDVLRADLNLRGQVHYADTPAGADITLRADGALEDFRANNMATAREGSTLALGEELLRWKALNAPGLALAVVPGKPMRLQVREAALTDFFARVAVEPDGRINLQNLVKPAAGGTAQASAPPAQITIGPMTLVQGQVLFSDRFVQPNYSADLSGLTGKLGAFATQPPGAEPRLADLELRGRAEGTAALEITGKINPLAKPLMLDIEGRVRDLELAPLSPYAIKYAGHGIERGKMSVVAHYQVERDGQLTASNKVVLNQLAFGEAVASAPNSLPVRLATALLADGQGTIDIDLPISGSLSDPEFSVGPVAWKALTNLIAKAVTSPFSLLGGTSGAGRENGGRVVFAPGSSVLDAQATQMLDTLIPALAGKTALSLTVTGTAHLQAERDALQRQRLKALLLAEKSRRAASGAQDAVALATVSDEEAPALLKAVYRRADITKPRNFLGIAKDLEPRDMEALLLASMPVDVDAMRNLARARGVVVKDYLVAHRYPSERLFLGDAKVDLSALAASPSANAAGGNAQPAAELSLAHL